MSVGKVVGVCAGLSFALGASACSPGAGGPLHLYEARYALPESLQQVCEQWLGEDADVSEVFSFELTYSHAKSSETHSCTYETRANVVVTVAFDQEEPGDDTVAFARDVSGVAVDVSDSSFLGPEQVEELRDWTDQRAESIVNDYDDWYAALPEAEVGANYTLDSSDLLFPDSGVVAEEIGRDWAETGTLWVPNARVATHALVEANLLPTVDGMLRPPADGTFYVVRLEAQGSNPSGNFVLDAGSSSASTLDLKWSELEAMTSSDDVLVVAAAPGESPELRVETDGVEQTMSLADGSVEDDGQSSSLREDLSRNATATVAASPVWYYAQDSGFFNEEGDPARETRRLSTPFLREVDYQWKVWDSELGWAEDGEKWLILDVGERDWNTPYPVYPLDVDSLDTESFSVDTAQGEFQASSVDGIGSGVIRVVYSLPSDTTAATASLSYVPTMASLNAMYQEKYDEDYNDRYTDMDAGEVSWSLSFAQLPE